MVTALVIDLYKK